MTAYDARTLARGWLSVALASSKDSGRPALDRTVSIESYPTGVRLAATDSYVLLHTWVPNLEHDLEPEPDMDEAPTFTAVAIDSHGRAKGFLAHALQLATAAAKADTGEMIEVRMRLGVLDLLDESDRPTLDGMAAAWVTLEIPDREKLKLRTYEGSFPSWRRVVAGFRAEHTDTVALNPEILGRLCQISKYQPGTYLAFRWGGPRSAAAVHTVQGWPDVAGVVMPVRWDFDTNAPRVDNDTDEPADDDTDGRPADDGDRDPMLAEAARLVITAQLGSTSMLQRKLRIGIARACLLMDQLAAVGVVGPGGGQTREVLLAPEQLADVLHLTNP